MASSIESISRHFSVDIGELKPSYNIAPGQSIAAIRRDPATGRRQLAVLDWGLLPLWAKGPGTHEPLIYLRVENVLTKPTYRNALQHRRCLVPADGFYQWQREHGMKQPFYVRMRDSHLFAFAALWERREESGQPPREACAILTTESNELLRPIHGRMPAIIPPEKYDLWLGEEATAEELAVLLRPYPARAMTAYPVSTAVNNPANDSPALTEPLEQQVRPEGTLAPLFDDAAKPRAHH